MNDLWKFNGSLWTWISGPDIADQFGVYGTQGVGHSENVPGSRGEAETAIIGDVLWLFGGSTSSLQFNDLWTFDGQNWTWVAGSSDPNVLGNFSSNGYPGARGGCGLAIDANNTFYIFGGYGYASINYRKKFQKFTHFQPIFLTIFGNMMELNGLSLGVPMIQISLDYTGE